MKLKIVLFSIVILSGLFLSAFGSPAASPAVKLQNTVAPTQPAITQVAVTQIAVTLVPPTVVVVTTPGIVPVTGGNSSTGLWTLVLFGLLALLGIAFLVAVFSPRPTRDDIGPNPPPPPDV